MRVQLICNASISDPIHTDVSNRFVLYLDFNHLDGLELSVGRLCRIGGGYIAYDSNKKECWAHFGVNAGTLARSEKTSSHFRFSASY